MPAPPPTLIDALAHPTSYLAFFSAIIATGLGAPVPEDAVVLAGGYLVYRGLTEPLPTLAIALVGVLVGDVALYFIGRGVGGPLLRNRFVARRVRAERREWAEQILARFGVAAVFVSRFVMGLRAGMYVTAGALRMPLGRFFVTNLAAALLSVPLFTWLGFHFGDRIDDVVQILVRVKLLALATILVGSGVAFLVWRRVWRRRR